MTSEITRITSTLAAGTGVLLIGAFCTASNPAETSGAANTASRFAADPTITRVTISPTGEYLAAIRSVEVGDNQSREALVVFRYPQMQLSATLALKDRLDVASYYWVNDNRLVARAAIQVKGFDASFYTNQRFGINADGTQLEQLRVNFSADKISLMRNDPKHVLVANYQFNGSRADVQVGTLNVYDGIYTRIARSRAKNAAMVADVDGNLRLSISQDDALNVRIHQFDGATRRWSLMSTTPFDASVPKPIRISSDGRYLDLLTTPDKGPEGIYRLDTQTNKRTLIYRHEIADVVPVLDHLENIWAVQHFHGHGGVIPIAKDHKLSELYRQVSPLFPEQLVVFASYAWDFSRVIVRVTSASATPQWFLLDNATNKPQLVKLFDSYPEIDDSLLGQVEPIRVTARDGLALHGYLTKPVQGKPPYPLVVMPHGGPLGVQDTWRFDADVQVLAANGYAVLQVNYRGSAGYGAYFGSQGIGEYGDAIHGDITDAARWAIAEGHADPSALCIYGWSYGGYAALYGAALEPDLYRCAVGAAGPYDMGLQHRRADYAYTRTGKAFSKKAVAETAASRKRISPITYVDRIKAKVFLVHGAKDQRVPVAHARKMRRALSKIGNKPRYLEMPKEGHGFRAPGNRAKFYRELVEFLDEATVAQTQHKPGDSQ